LQVPADIKPGFLNSLHDPLRNPGWPATLIRLRLRASDSLRATIIEEPVPGNFHHGLLGLAWSSSTPCLSSRPSRPLASRPVEKSRLVAVDIAAALVLIPSVPAVAAVR